MIQQPDKLFKEKLSNYQKSAPPVAWEKIELTLRKKRKHSSWLLVAATLLILVAISFLLPDRSVVIDPGAETNTVIKDSIAIPENYAKGKDNTGSPASALAGNKKETKNAGKEITKKRSEINTKKASTPVNTNHENNTERITQSEAVQETLPIANLPAGQESAAQQITITEAGNFKLIMDAHEVNKKYLNEPLTEEATIREKKSSAWRKLLSKAHELKTNQDPFGELRQAKNEILALNFKNEKNRD